ncbi:hypothetical protein Golob_019486 [Gossypium lobatum]|uniref:IBR domain-containing protein n=1 Tax=Gossypium lobatum TaxID=34289 RepID=A0A7J8L7G4_9ROSI|nr:hypothetical protein [Gossypium lobatum]
MSSSTEIFSSSREKLKAKPSNMRIHKRKLHDHQVQNNSPMKKQKGVIIDELPISNPITDVLTSGSSNPLFCRLCGDKTLLRISSTRRIAVIGSAPIAFDVTSWDDALLYSVILPVLVFECPYEDCKAKLIDEVMGGTESECPNCLTIICGECRDFKHDGMGCEKFKEFVNC